MVDIIRFFNKINKMKKTIIVAVVLILVFVGGEILMNKMSKVEYQMDQEAKPEVVSKITDELQRIIDEENFRKETILRARKVANDRKKEEEIERNKKAMGVIEAEYEAIRQAELELVGGNTSSLK